MHEGQAVSSAQWGGDRSRMVDRSLDILARSSRDLVPDQRERLAPPGGRRRKGEVKMRITAGGGWGAEGLEGAAETSRAGSAADDAECERQRANDQRQRAYEADAAWERAVAASVLLATDAGHLVTREHR